MQGLQRNSSLLLVIVLGFVVWIPAAVTTGNALRDSRGKSILAWVSLVLVAVPLTPVLRAWYDFLKSA